MFSDPFKNLKTLSLEEDMVVADVGVGSGFYAIHLAKLLPRGKVYAIDVQKDFLNSLKNKALDAGLHNIVCLHGDVEKKGGTKIGDLVLDLALASNILFQVEDKESFLKEVFRILKQNGRLLLIDWSDNSFLSKSDLSKSISEKDARELCERAGFLYSKNIDVGEHHYGIIFSKIV